MGNPLSSGTWTIERNHLSGLSWGLTQHSMAKSIQEEGPAGAMALW